MSKVFFAKNLKNIEELFDRAGLCALIKPEENIALKIHFGEPGNTAYLKPEEVKPICGKIKRNGGKPFYTDCNTLYKGPRNNTQDHLKVAREHGYVLEKAGAEALIPEENNFATVEVNLKHFKRVYLGAPTVNATVIIALTHFKGHEMTGFGGALKNVGMGLGTKRGKLRMHQDCKHCDLLKTCRKNQTIESCWVGSPLLVQEKMVEYAYGAVKDKRCGYINFLVRISPNCDCYGFNDPPIVPDIGVLASLDPVAIDQASIDLVNQYARKDIFREIHSSVDWAVQLKYAEEIGLGSRTYEIANL